MNKKTIVAKVLRILETNNVRIKKRAEKIYDELSKDYPDEDDLIYEIADRLS